MGKGDKKTKRGKIIMGSYGVRRPKSKHNADKLADNSSKKKKATATKIQTKKPEAPKTKPEKNTVVEAKTPVKAKSTAKKPASKKSEVKKNEVGENSKEKAKEKKD